ncbi:radical SAM protein [Thermococcus sp. Bubb.Bath]|uniref:radical SAM protein n=1 Tax=Thermococcus sp. Bubb.Bath TaxID=1638242 RepID=UPI0014389BE1|nr:radical SAM protein [Thermococcus sp. Bubb.Bath]NJF24746.1 radical SAM protein [Thermococcus sp. Bubb.Bath]
MVKLVRVSYGTAIAMGLIRAKLLARPTTAYLMTYWPGRCSNDCAFCAQARSSRADLEKLSRVVWPAFRVDEVVERLKNGDFARICLQTIEYPGMLDDVFELLEAFSTINLPVSISVTPVDSETLERFKSLGVDYIGVGLDAASERIFGDIKPDASWNELWDFTARVVNVFGQGRAVIHIIVGLGETDREVVDAFIRARRIGADVSLFAFTPIKGTRLENLKPPSVERYRRIQLARYLVSIGGEDTIVFEGDSIRGFTLSEEKLLMIPPTVFMTHGCPGCNRPYYNERPGKEPYNYPFPPKREEAMKTLGLIL